MDARNSPARLRDLDRAKGLGIFLVVLGHIVATAPPAGNEWYVPLRAAIYHFHMPFFLFITGLVAGVTWKPLRAAGDYRRFVARKFDRLIPPYLLMAAVVFAGKWFAQSAVHVDHPIVSPAEFLEVFYSPRTSYSRFLWYIYVLFPYYLFVPALLADTRPVRWVPSLALALALSCYGQYGQPPPWFGIDLFCQYAIFFYGGVVAGAHWPAYAGFVDRWGAAVGAVFAVTVAGIWAAWWDLARLWTGLLSCAGLHRLAREEVPLGSAFEWLGRYSFPIYLLNTIAIGSVKAVVLAFTSWDGARFFAIAPLLLASGLLLPIAARQAVLRRIPLLDRWTA